MPHGSRSRERPIGVVPRTNRPFYRSFCWVRGPSQIIKVPPSHGKEQGVVHFHFFFRPWTGIEALAEFVKTREALQKQKAHANPQEPLGAEQRNQRARETMVQSNASGQTSPITQKHHPQQAQTRIEPAAYYTQPKSSSIAAPRLSMSPFLIP